MTPKELVETAVRKYPLGHPVISMALDEASFWRNYLDTPYSELGNPGYASMSILLETVLDGLPDVPPRTGDCAELLADAQESTRSLSPELVDLMAALKASLAATTPNSSTVEEESK